MDVVIFSIPRQLVNLIDSIGVDSTDSNEQRLQRTLLVGIALMIALAGILWGVIYIALGEFLAGSIQLSTRASHSNCDLCHLHPLGALKIAN